MSNPWTTAWIKRRTKRAIGNVLGHQYHHKYFEFHKIRQKHCYTPNVPLQYRLPNFIFSLSLCNTGTYKKQLRNQTKHVDVWMGKGISPSLSSHRRIYSPLHDGVTFTLHYSLFNKSTEEAEPLCFMCFLCFQIITVFVGHVWYILWNQSL